MIARSESSVRARTSSGLAVGATAPILASSLESSAGHMPSIAESQSGRGGGIGARVHGGGSADLMTSPTWSRSESKNARHDGSTELGSSAQRACRSSTKPALPP